jgi:hypothetical protein
VNPEGTPSPRNGNTLKDYLGDQQRHCPTRPGGNRTSVTRNAHCAQAGVSFTRPLPSVGQFYADLPQEQTSETGDALSSPPRDGAITLKLERFVTTRLDFFPQKIEAE